MPRCPRPQGTVRRNSRSPACPSAHSTVNPPTSRTSFVIAASMIGRDSRSDIYSRASLPPRGIVFPSAENGCGRALLSCVAAEATVGFCFRFM